MITNAEYLLEGNRIGILLIHGLTGTPNEMSLVARGLHKAGFTVYGMQLAGHCGDESDLLKTGWKDWYRSVELSVERLSKQVDHIFIAGLSMGAMLSLKFAADYPEKVAGVGVYGVTFKYDGWSIPFYAKHLGFMLNVLNFFKIGRSRVFIEQPPYGLKDERIRRLISQSMLSGNSVAAGLAGNPWPSLAEMNTLSRLTKNSLQNIKAPCLVLHASDDDIAHISNAELVCQSVKGPVKFIPLEDSYHIITVDREHPRVIKETIQFINQLNLPLANESAQYQKAAGQ